VLIVRQHSSPLLWHLSDISALRNLWPHLQLLRGQQLTPWPGFPEPLILTFVYSPDILVAWESVLWSILTLQVITGNLSLFGPYMQIFYNPRVISDLCFIAVCNVLHVLLCTSLCLIVCTIATSPIFMHGHWTGRYAPYFFSWRVNVSFARLLPSCFAVRLTPVLALTDNQYRIVEDRFLVMAASSRQSVSKSNKEKMDKVWKDILKSEGSMNEADYMEHTWARHRCVASIAF